LASSFIDKGIPDNGRVLTELSLFWFHKFEHIISNHDITSRIEEMPEEVQQHKEQLEGHSILVRNTQVVPLEAIVRGYLTGEYSTLLDGE
jgi:phosphoribosylaminoimidazole-succinocarboxamide synthase